MFEKQQHPTVTCDLDEWGDVFRDNKIENMRP
jgi:hypothetical protein